MTILTAGDALLVEIIARPHDRRLRLIYADWLEEYGDDSPSARSRIDGIRSKRKTRFDNCGGINPMLLGVQSVEYHWGFLEVVRAPFEVLCKGLPRWVTEHPLTAVEVSDKKPWFDGDDEQGWAWRESGETEPESVIDHPSLFEELWKKAHPDDRHGDDIGRWVFYYDEAEGNKALSDTLLDMARRRLL
jgi:uncharacterized protein (TIGR02996 family)